MPVDQKPQFAHPTPHSVGRGEFECGQLLDIAPAHPRADQLTSERRRRRHGLIRLRLGAGAVVALVIVVLAITVMISLFSKSGTTTTVGAVATASRSAVDSLEPAPGTNNNETPSPSAPSATSSNDDTRSQQLTPDPAGKQAGGHALSSARNLAAGDGSGGNGSAAQAPAANQQSAGPGVVVHILGAVAAPGLYTLPAGTRVNDAIRAAGGAKGEADQTANNLARVLADGEQIYVPVVGETPPNLDRLLGNAASGGNSPGAAGVAKAAATGAKVNINLADATALETLPRIGPVSASNIIAYRRDNGTFASVDDLALVTGIGPKTLEGLRDRATV